MAPFISRTYSIYFRNKAFLWSLFLGILFLVGSLVLNYYAGLYATEKASNAVTDIILDNTPVIDADGFFVYGSILFWLFVLALCIQKVQRIPFILKSIALFVCIRSVFISLTHIGPFPDHTIIDSNLISRFTFGGDLFFSGHTGLPFLMALVFWDSVYLRIFFTTAALVFGGIVLITHLHYSIDVLAAFFITYSIFRMAELIFEKEKTLFVSGLKE